MYHLVLYQAIVAQRFLMTVLACGYRKFINLAYEASSPL